MNREETIKDILEGATSAQDIDELLKEMGLEIEDITEDYDYE